jgi:hypothetical protein
LPGCLHQVPNQIDSLRESTEFLQANHRGISRYCDSDGRAAGAGFTDIYALGRKEPASVQFVHNPCYFRPQPFRAESLSESLHKITPIYATLIISSEKARVPPDSGLPVEWRSKKIFLGVSPLSVTIFDDQVVNV